MKTYNIGKRKFTLVELIIIIVVLALISSLAIPRFITVQKEAKVATLIRDIDTLEKVIPVYYNKHDEYPITDKVTLVEKSDLWKAVLITGDSGKQLYKVDLNKTRSYHTKLKHGYSGEEDDYFIYSIETGYVYYAKGIINKEGKLVFGDEDAQGKIDNYLIKDVMLNDKFLVVNKETQVAPGDYTITGKVLYDKTVDVYVNGEQVPVIYDTMANNRLNIYAGEDLYKRFTAEKVFTKGNYTVKIESGDKSVSYNIKANNPPVAIIKVSPDTTITTKMNIVWDASFSYDPDGDEIVEFEWSGDKRDKYETPGEYKVTLRVKDDSDRWSTPETLTINVIEPREILQLENGTNHSLALLDDGTVWTWGTKPVKIQNLSDVKHIAVTRNMNAAIKNDGTLWTWSYPSTEAAQVTLISDVEQIALGSAHYVVLKTNGTVWTWGYNAYGQVGDGTKKDKSTPYQILSNIKQVSAGLLHSVALANDGSVYVWGKNDNYESGRQVNRSDPQLTPYKLTGGMKQIDAGSYHTLALTTDGRVYAWGNNESGRLGIGYGSDARLLSQISISNIKQISAGDNHSMALTEDGKVYVWGNNGYGQLGTGNTRLLTSPTQLTSINNVNKILAGENCSFAIKENGTVSAWGRNNNGKLGNGNTVNQLNPVSVLQDLLY